MVKHEKVSFLRENFSFPEPLSLRKRVLEWVETMRVKHGSYGRYKMSPSTRPYLLSSCYAAFIRELYSDLANLSTGKRKEWIDYINSCQDEGTGLFCDPEMRPEQVKNHSWEYLSLQSTTLCLSALSALQGTNRYPLHYDGRWYNPSGIVQWLKERDWSDAWMEANTVMFVGILLIREFTEHRTVKAKKVLEKMLQWLDQFQDPCTGYWGTREGASLLNGMAGAYHLYLLYYYLDRPLKYLDKIIDFTLSLQQEDGFFSPRGGGGACEDIDAIDTLVNAYQRTTYRRADIVRALMRALPSLLVSQNEDGGFVYARRRRFHLKEWIRLLTFMKEDHWTFKWRLRLMGAVLKDQFTPGRGLRNTEWPKMTVPVRESDMLATWFRSLTIAEISQIFPESPYASLKWTFRDSPGLGWFQLKNEASFGQDKEEICGL